MRACHNKPSLMSIVEICPLVGLVVCRLCEPDTQFGKFIHEPHLVDVAHWGFAVWQNPFGMLSSEVVMNLLPEIRDCVRFEHYHSPLA